MMHFIFFCLLFVVGLSGIPVCSSGVQVKQEVGSIHEGGKEDAPLQIRKKILDSLIKIKTLRADFQQQTSESQIVKKGSLVLSRPGKLKMQIQEPDQELILLKGKWLTHHIPNVDEVSHIPLEETPARVLLDTDEALDKRLQEAEIEVETGTVHLKMSYNSNGLKGTLVMGFDAESFLLHSWLIIDSSGHRTVVQLSHQQVNVKISPEEFIFMHRR